MTRKNSNPIRSLLAGISVLTIACSVVFGDTIYVDTGASGANNGASWTNAYILLQDGLDEATSGDEIWVAAGIYYPTVELGGSGARYQTFQMKNGVAIYGGFANTGNPTWQDRDPATYDSIISGDIGTPADSSDNCYHVFYHPDGTGLDATAVLDGCTVTGGNADSTGNWPHDAGGGMFNYQCSPTVTNCTFTYNAAERGGGIASWEYSDPAITYCTFTYNSALWYGGGICNWNYSDATITHCTFTNNSCDYNGGGLENDWGCTPTITHCTFTNNTAGTGGGGLANDHASPTVSHCTFSNNSATEGGAFHNWTISNSIVTNCTFSENTATTVGGGMYSRQCEPTVAECVFSDNQAQDHGGGMYHTNSCDPNITNCTFNDNSASDNGGGIANYDNCEPMLTGCTFSGNTANYGGGMYSFQNNVTVNRCSFYGNLGLGSGGGIYNHINTATLTNNLLSGNSADFYGGGMYNNNSSPELINCTFSGNTAEVFGGGIYNHQNSSPIATNCVFWGNTAPTGPQIYDAGSGTTTATYSDVQAGFTGAGNLDADPLFVDADGADDIAGTDDDDLRLSPGSPCIDAANNNAVPAGITTDLDDLSRFIDDFSVIDTGIGTPPIVDMGAYESGTQKTMTVDKLILKAGKVPGDGQDSFMIQGQLQEYLPGDYVNGDLVVLQLGEVAPFTLETQFKKAGKKEKYSYKDKGPGLTAVKLDFEKGTCSLSGKNVDLTGLAAPVPVTLMLGNYYATGTAADSGTEDVINGKKPTPMQFMSGYMNRMEFGAAFKAGKQENVGTMTLSGSIAAANLTAAPNEGQVTIHLDSQEFVVATGEFAQKGKNRKYAYKGNKPTDGSAYLATGQIDLDKCTCKFVFKNLNVTGMASPATMQLEFTNFNKTADFSY